MEDQRTVEEIKGGLADTLRVPSPARADRVRPASLRMTQGSPASMEDKVSSSGWPRDVRDGPLYTCEVDESSGRARDGLCEEIDELESTLAMASAALGGGSGAGRAAQEGARWMRCAHGGLWGGFYRTRGDEGRLESRPWRRLCNSTRGRRPRAARPPPPRGLDWNGRRHRDRRGPPPQDLYLARRRGPLLPPSASAGGTPPPHTRELPCRHASPCSLLQPVVAHSGDATQASWMENWRGSHGHTRKLDERELEVGDRPDRWGPPVSG